MTVTIARSREPLNLRRVSRVEHVLGCTFPGEYRDFLLAHNGGRPEEGVFPISTPQHDHHGLLDNFLCIKARDPYDLLTWVRDYRGRLPRNLLPVAVDQAGNLICLSVAGSDTGGVYFWDHEMEASQGKTPSYDNVYPVADSFQAFLDSLRPVSGSNAEDAT